MKTSAEIKKEVIDRLRRQPSLEALNISVDVMGDVVFLSGRVDSYRKKFDAGKLIRSLEDVKKVHLDLYVDLPAGDKKTDAAIKDAIADILRQSIFTDIEILFSIREGVVILTGETKSLLQKNKLMNEIINVPGILNICDFIKVKKAATGIKLNGNNNRANNKIEIPANPLAVVQ
ncbi:BON domain-containing protein [Parafilimonas sp.]|uniref:BON domain-containing protein n=1 Tax=Parafilimonas sp. TaxID=1969739 RepID=UPI003F812886